jgi:hypothetical protein
LLISGINPLKNITTGRDFGASLEVLSGLAMDDNLVVNPPDSLTTGTRVRVVPSPSLYADGAARSSR